MLVNRLMEETRRARPINDPVRILNIGCGPAVEVSRFLACSELSNACHFTLMDFNEQTLAHARKHLEQARSAHGRRTKFEWKHKSIHELLRNAAQSRNAVPEFDLVYCAGLYDYLTDRVCSRLTSLFYGMVKPGGLVVATNVHPSNPVRYYMEFLVEWYLVYRDEAKMQALARGMPRPQITTDETGVNVFMDLRKPEAPSRG